MTDNPTTGTAMGADDDRDDAGVLRMLDLFSGVGGAARGLQRLGYEVVGFDIDEQPKYPDEHHVRDLRDGLPSWVYDEQWAGVWASPPCTPFTGIEAFRSGDNLIPVARHLVDRVDAGFAIIENVPGAAHLLRDPVALEGGAFGLEVRKRRVFETNFAAPSRLAPGIEYEHVIGDAEHPVESYREAHGFDADSALAAKELREAIPPAYVEYLVGQYQERETTTQGVLA